MRHFGEIKQPKPLISRNEELYISNGAKKENALASEGKSCLPKKINMRVSRPLSMSKSHNGTETETPSLALGICEFRQSYF